MKITKRQLRKIIVENVFPTIDVLPVDDEDGDGHAEFNVGWDKGVERETIKKQKKKHKEGDPPKELDLSTAKQNTDYRGKSHQGIDIFGRLGADVPAMISGFVHKADTESGKGGNVVIIATKKPENLSELEGKDDVDFSDYKYPKGTKFLRYAHMESLSAKTGDEVDEGDLIGTLGATGSAAAFTLSDKTKGGHIHLSIFGTNSKGKPSYYLHTEDPWKKMKSAVDQASLEARIDAEVETEGSFEGDFEGALRAAGVDEEEIQRMKKSHGF